MNEPVLACPAPQARLAPWMVYQDPRFLDLLAAHYDWRREVWSGVNALGRPLPGLGALRAKVWNPEVCGDDWCKALLEAPVGYFDVMSNFAVQVPGVRCISSPDLMSMLVDLSGGADAIFERMESRARKGIRHALREGLTSACSASADDLTALHALLLRVTDGGRKYEVPPLPLLQALQAAGLSRTYVARWGGQVVGGGVCLGTTISHGFVSGFDAAACKGLPGTLLYYDLLVAEGALGATHFDLGAQSVQDHPGLALAKRAYSPIQIPAYRYLIEPRSARARLQRQVLRAAGHAMPR
ncbi:GNAT family N-acetyltransferase [Methyloversatilis sp. XJ19-49]|uniref:GNAT family N-acetyltransferase n=1 Tax=Methyloversatilis sp. XJ19-49 TaxID=2963429 RepID=UPI00211C1994|nr:GNAT family N-acetyltransferase [Methyloversatilis sp. XJ19-49]MCQ9376820.1 GNAT family N-acetyltransferase [Methyloversatilis sp. XJ19-49]